MPAIKATSKAISKAISKAKTLPGQFNELVKEMLPRAISDDVHNEQTIEMIDRLMRLASPTKGQRQYMETLVQLVEAYEAKHHAVDTSNLSGLDSLKHLMSESSMNASELARLLGTHVSMGSKILSGERSLTIEHIKKLAARFHVDPGLFIV